MTTLADIRENSRAFGKSNGYEAMWDVSCNINNNGRSLYALDTGWEIVGTYYSDAEKKAKNGGYYSFLYDGDVGECSLNKMAFIENIRYLTVTKDIIESTVSLKAAESLGFVAGKNSVVFNVNHTNPEDGGQLVFAATLAPARTTETYTNIYEADKSGVSYINLSVKDAVTGKETAGACLMTEAPASHNVTSERGERTQAAREMLAFEAQRELGSVAGSGIQAPSSASNFTVARTGTPSIINQILGRKGAPDACVYNTELAPV